MTIENMREAGRQHLMDLLDNQLKQHPINPQADQLQRKSHIMCTNTLMDKFCGNATAVGPDGKETKLFGPLGDDYDPDYGNILCANTEGAIMVGLDWDMLEYLDDKMKHAPTDLRNKDTRALRWLHLAKFIPACTEENFDAAKQKEIAIITFLILYNADFDIEKLHTRYKFAHEKTGGTPVLCLNSYVQHDVTTGAPHGAGGSISLLTVPPPIMAQVKAMLASETSPADRPRVRRRAGRGTVVDENSTIEALMAALTSGKVDD